MSINVLQSESYFQTVSVRYFAGIYLSSCTRSPHRSLISIIVWEWSTSSCSDRQKESGNSVVKENSAQVNRDKSRHIFPLPFTTHTTSHPWDTYTFLVKGLIVPHTDRSLTHYTALLALVGERQRRALISIVISGVVHSLHAWWGSLMLAWMLTSCCLFIHFTTDWWVSGLCLSDQNKSAPFFLYGWITTVWLPDSLLTNVRW